MNNCADFKLAGTASNEVFFPRQDDYNDWKKGVNTYVHEKNNFEVAKMKSILVKKYTAGRGRRSLISSTGSRSVRRNGLR